MLGISVAPLFVGADTGFQPTVEACRKLVTPKTKAIVLVSPNNPVSGSYGRTLTCIFISSFFKTGAIYSPSLLSSFALFARDANIALIIDETYRDLILNGSPHHLFVPGKQGHSISPAWDWRRTLIHLFSFSKSYSIPGHRLGAIVAGREVLDEANTVLDCFQICAPRSAQLAIHPLLPNLRPFIRETAQALIHRHELFKSLLPRGWKIGSQGAYYAFVEHPFKGVSALDVSKRLAIEGGIITLPINFFSPPAISTSPQLATVGGRWIRFSVANIDDDKIRSVCQRLRELPSEFGWTLRGD